MITEAIILAGGLGTRLRSVVADVPKCMAPVSGKPFLAYLINALQNQGIEKFIFSLGYKSEIILQYLANEFPNLNTQIVVEKEPLGTGGAIRLACEKVAGDDVLIFNGDTFFDINLKTFSAFHHTQNAACSIALKTMQQFDRYGSVEISEEHIVTAFNEKKFLQNGIINAGIYALKVKPFLKFDFPAIFSFEKMYLEKNTVTHKIYGKQFADF
ncbi:MAG TPA: sugar phosphate nucleotidyltransferase, partial [Ferruginibacter sp.]|nr:sugar phosphate nucleotidyltransferase [Ferruginibacter sp.]